MVHDECRDERQRDNGMTDLQEQIDVVNSRVSSVNSFKFRRLILRDVVERYRKGFHEVDTMRRAKLAW